MLALAIAAVAQDTVPIAVVPAPSFADQIVPIAVAVATAIGIIMAALLPAISNVRKLIVEIKGEQSKQAEIVNKLETNTNSISEKLRHAVETGALAAGKLAGRAELKAELNADSVAIQGSKTADVVAAPLTNP